MNCVKCLKKIELVGTGRFDDEGVEFMTARCGCEPISFIPRPETVTEAEVRHATPITNKVDRMLMQMEGEWVDRVLAWHLPEGMLAEYRRAGKKIDGLVLNRRRVEGSVYHKIEVRYQDRLLGRRYFDVSRTCLVEELY